MTWNALRLPAAAWAFALAGCAQLPAHPHRTPSYAAADTGGTAIGRMLEPLTAGHPQESGAHLLLNGLEAFAARLRLIEVAERSVDLQYYIWRDDTSGTLLARALWDAAERGVHVRILLDDANTAGLDTGILAMDAHPNIEVRLFNPFPNRTLRVGDFLTDFGRVQRRMHNKSFTVDNRVTLVGGRNVGDEYLGGQSAVAFMDMDLMTIGPIVQEVSADFDEYWNSASAYPAASVLRPLGEGEVAELRGKWDRRSAGPDAQHYLAAARSLSLVEQMRAATLPLAWGAAWLLSDDPAKILHSPERSDLTLGRQLMAAFNRPNTELLLVSPYFVPGTAGTDMLVGLAQRGIRVSVLTNSLAATDEPAVYAGYLHYRDALLRGGVRVYELKPAARPPGLPDEDEQRVRGLFGSKGGNSGAALHAKTLAVDRSRIFVGSYNLDPRSARLNTELGILLDSPVIASRLATLFDTDIPANAYELRLDDAGKVLWIEHTPEGEVAHATTPGASAWKSFWIGVLSGLPIEELL